MELSYLRKVRQLTEKYKREMTSQDIFGTREFRRYAQRLVDGIVGNTAIPVTVHVSNEGPDGVAGFTDGSFMHINWANELATHYDELETQFMAVLGFIFHETGHIKYYDFNATRTAMSRLGQGFVYGDWPIPDDMDEEKALKEMQEVIKNKKYALVFQKLFSDLENRVADAHDEDKMIQNHGILVESGIRVSANAMRATAAPIEAMIAEPKATPLMIMASLVLQYARYKSVVGETDIPEAAEYMACLEKMKPHIEAAQTTDDPEKKFSELNYLVLYLWPYIREMLMNAEQLAKLAKMMQDLMKDAPKQENKQNDSNQEGGLPIFGDGDSTMDRDPTLEELAIASAAEQQGIGERNNKKDNGQEQNSGNSAQNSQANPSDQNGSQSGNDANGASNNTNGSKGEASEQNGSSANGDTGETGENPSKTDSDFGDSDAQGNANSTSDASGQNGEQTGAGNGSVDSGEEDGFGSNSSTSSDGVEGSAKEESDSSASGTGAGDDVDEESSMSEGQFEDDEEFEDYDPYEDEDFDSDDNAGADADGNGNSAGDSGNNASDADGGSDEETSGDAGSEGADGTAGEQGDGSDASSGARGSSMGINEAAVDPQAGSHGEGAGDPGDNIRSACENPRMQGEISNLDAPTQEQLRNILDSLAEAAKNAGKTNKRPENRISSQEAIDAKRKERASAGKMDKPTETEQGSAPEQSSEMDAEAEARMREQAERVMAKIIGDMARTKAEREVEEEIRRTRLSDLRGMDVTEVHKGVPVNIVRTLDVTESDKRLYEMQYETVRSYSRRLIKRTELTLRDYKDGSITHHKLWGNRLEVGQTYRLDQKFYATKKLPQDLPDMAVCILMDQSGSMRMDDRYLYAMRAGVLLHDFCTGMKIPCQVAGHDAGQAVSYHIYADYDNVSKDDKYRIAQMTPGGSNRDGLALIVAAEALAKRPEDLKLLIVISDGKPNHSDYGGEAAMKDISTIVTKYRRRYGIETIGAAIGSDKQVIRMIYQDKFLDISDLENLPKALLGLIVKRLQQE